MNLIVGDEEVAFAVLADQKLLVDGEHLDLPDFLDILYCDGADGGFRLKPPGQSVEHTRTFAHSEQNNGDEYHN